MHNSEVIVNSFDYTNINSYNYLCYTAADLVTLSWERLPYFQRVEGHSSVVPDHYSYKTDSVVSFGKVRPVPHTL